MKYYFTTIILLFSTAFLGTHALAKSSEQVLDKREQVIVFLILQNTTEVKIHQMGGKTNNQVMLGPKGHKEAVYDGKGKLVRDGINDASYNYKHPVKEPLLHYGYDIHPWIMMGSSPHDPTSQKQRIYAYMGDLESGIRKAHAQNAKLDKLEKELNFTKEQQQILQLWARILKKKKADALFSYFDLDRPMTDAEILSVMKAVYKNFQSTYK